MNVGFRIRASELEEAMRLAKDISIGHSGENLAEALRVSPIGSGYAAFDILKSAPILRRLSFFPEIEEKAIGVILLEMKLDFGLRTLVLSEVGLEHNAAKHAHAVMNPELADLFKKHNQWERLEKFAELYGADIDAREARAEAWRSKAEFYRGRRIPFSPRSGEPRRHR